MTFKSQIHAKAVIFSLTYQMRVPPFPTKHLSLRDNSPLVGTFRKFSGQDHGELYQILPRGQSLIPASLCLVEI